MNIHRSTIAHRFGVRGGPGRPEDSNTQVRLSVMLLVSSSRVRRPTGPVAYLKMYYTFLTSSALVDGLNFCPYLDDVEKNKYAHQGIHVIIVCRGGICRQCGGAHGQAGQVQRHGPVCMFRVVQALQVGVDQATIPARYPAGTATRVPSRKRPWRGCVGNAAGVREMGAPNGHSVEKH